VVSPNKRTRIAQQQLAASRTSISQLIKLCLGTEVSRKPMTTDRSDTARSRESHRAETGFDRPRALSDDFAADNAKLLKDYCELVEGIRMIRRAAERACRAGVLPAIDHGGKTPLQECEAVARAIYRSAVAPGPHEARRTLTGLNPDDASK
jgi:hypothetical protein